MEVPSASSPAVHNVMVANKSTNTKPELSVRSALRSAGFSGYRLHWRIDDERGRYVCRPDITFPGRKLAVFVHDATGTVALVVGSAPQKPTPTTGCRNSKETSKEIGARSARSWKWAGPSIPSGSVALPVE